MTREEHESRWQSFKAQRKVDGALAIIGTICGFESMAACQRARGHAFKVEESDQSDNIAAMRDESERQFEDGDEVYVRMLEDFEDAREDEVCVTARVIGEALVNTGRAVPCTRTGRVKWSVQQRAANSAGSAGAT